MIEVDDSGWGDLIGGAVIVMRRVETGETHVGRIPLEYFREPNFKYQEYLRAATQITLEGLDALKAPNSEPIHVCTGFILSAARETLKELGYDVHEAKITGATQELAETEFIESLSELGVGKPKDIAAMRSFNGFLDWVKENPATRERYVKTGWSSWRKHSEELQR
ncbi:hypothetical protein E2P71_04570 [Candidatus Bathyarchaeota archaeon]|nr:hypothetical protein E2P71_04570 [Candidatus Bathyarchaeota archaeon]